MVNLHAVFCTMVLESWNTLSQDQQQTVSTLNNFICGMHVLVGMADTASATLCQWGNYPL